MLEDRIQDVTTTSGLGSYALANTCDDGNRTISAVIASGKTVRFWVSDGDTGFETGTGVFNSPSTLTRAVIESSSNGNAAVNWPDNSPKTIWIAPSARDLVYQLPNHLGTAGGTANAQTLTPATVLRAYRAGHGFSYLPASDNTGAVTLAVSGLASPRNVFKPTPGGAVAMIGGEMRASMPVRVLDDGTRYVAIGGLTKPSPLLAQATDLALSASHHDALIAFDTTGADHSPTLPAASTGAGLRYTVRKGAGSSNKVVLTCSGTDKLVWPASADATGVASIKLPTIGDTVTVESDGSSKWLIVHENVRGPYARVSRGSAQSVSSGATAQIDYDTVTVDTHGDTSGSGNTITPEVPGVYRVTASVGMAIASGRTLILGVYKAGAVVAQTVISAGATGVHVIQAGIEINLSGSEAIIAKVTNGDTGSQNVDASAYNSFMTVERLK